MSLIKKTAGKVAKYLSGISGEGVDINTAYTDEHYKSPMGHDNERGIQVYTTSDLFATTGKTEDGGRLTAKTEQKYFFLTVNERNQIFRLSSPVFGIVTSRMNRISALDFNVMPIREVEDRVVDELRSKKQVYDEFAKQTDLQYLLLKAKIVTSLKEDLPELLPDLSNFDGCLLRWKKRIQNNHQSKGEEIKDWLLEPNQGVTWDDYVKKLIYDLMIHGASATYKQKRADKVLENFDLLIGGSVFKLKNPYFSGMSGYVQVIYGFEPQIFYGDEMSYCQYIPVSVQNYGMIPLEALINKVSEGLLFDKLMADRADGTRVPEKMVVITDNNNPFKNFDKDHQDYPTDVDEQKRVEEKLNEPIKGGVMTFSGNHASIVDLSRGDTLDVQNARQKDIREEAALVYNMSNMEINLTGSGDTSGRSTSETQMEIDQGKGIAPMIKLLENHTTKDIIYDRFGYGYRLSLQQQKNEKEEKELDILTLQTGEMTQNEIREKYNKSSFVGDEYNLPKDNAGGEQGESEQNPTFSKQVE